MKIGKACILCEGQNINHTYTREAVASLEGKRFGQLDDRHEITVEEVGGKLCAFIEVELPAVFFIANAAYGKPITEILEVGRSE